MGTSPFLVQVIFDVKTSIEDIFFYHHNKPAVCLASLVPVFGISPNLIQVGFSIKTYFKPPDDRYTYICYGDIPVYHTSNVFWQIVLVNPLKFDGRATLLDLECIRVQYGTRGVLG